MTAVLTHGARLRCARCGETYVTYFRPEKVKKPTWVGFPGNVQKTSKWEGRPCKGCGAILPWLPEPKAGQ